MKRIIAVIICILFVTLALPATSYATYTKSLVGDYVNVNIKTLHNGSSYTTYQFLTDSDRTNYSAHMAAGAKLWGNSIS